MAIIDADYTLFELTLLKTAVEDRIAQSLTCASGVCGSDHTEEQLLSFTGNAVVLRRIQADLEDALACAAEEECECHHGMTGSTAPAAVAEPGSFASQAVRADQVDPGEAPLALVKPQ